MLEISSRIPKHHPRRTLASCRSQQIPWSWTIQISKLGWHVHITSIMPTDLFGFIRRNLNQCPENVKEQVYLALVRPQLEYGCCTRDPHIQKRIRDIARAQRRAARFVNIALHMELSRKFWWIWNGQHSRKDISYTISTLNNILIKSDRALGNSTLRNSLMLVLKQKKTNTVLFHVQSETGTPYQMVSLKSSQ